MHWRETIAAGFSAVTVVVLLAATANWLKKETEAPAVAIQAAHDVPDNGLPVFAQFIVTQSLLMKDIARAATLKVPMYFPENNEPLQIDLRREGKLVQRWRLSTRQKTGVEEVNLPIEPPALLEGKLEVVFNGRDILYDRRSQAPRIFIETADVNYPDGNYRVAENNKEGDVGLELWELKPRWQVLKENAGRQPWVAGRYALLWFLAVWLGSAWPWLLKDLLDCRAAGPLRHRKITAMTPE